MTCWTVMGDTLEVVLQKSESGLMWPEVVVGDTLGEYVPDPALVDDVVERLAPLTSDIEATPPSGATFNSQQVEECDFECDKLTILERLSRNSHNITHKVNFGSHQVLLTVNLDKQTQIGKCCQPRWNLLTRCRACHLSPSKRHHLKMDEKNISKTHDDIQCKIKIKRRIVNNQLKGKVTIGSPTPLNIDRAYIEITGIANCSWKLDSMCFKFPRIYPENTPVKGFQQFYYTRHSLCGGDIAHRHKGTESYPFVAYWPSRLPGTWYGDHGSIEYLAKVTLHLAKNADIFNYSQFVAVIPRRHLSTEKHLLFEGRIDVTRSFQTYRAEGYVTVSVWLPISGIAAGQGLPVLCSITNCSRLHFGSILFMLTRTDIYRWACLICRPQFILQTGG
ncbi:hypothetical protein Zmor_008046 [Zophobas morio]|uniref:Arrestin-like N-terminal domain-containing protein n=1 Tax=Zophobas morio TaxID=2755281 RepID=A0AA38J3C0_9CUCU|nr:hypothetical protein Zmor_008046 [Zophobas morio]